MACWVLEAASCGFGVGIQEFYLPWFGRDHVEELAAVRNSN